MQWADDVVDSEWLIGIDLEAENQGTFQCILSFHLERLRKPPT